MFGINELALFITAGLLLNITPGVDMLYVMHRAGTGGFKSGFIASLGIAGGCLIHICFAVIGLSALLATSSIAFTIIKYIGAAYLVYLGITMLLTGQQSPSNQQFSDQENLWKVFKQGVLINALNPKVALFFLAFIPQFIDVDSTQKALAFLILGLIFNINGTLLLIVIAWLTTKAKNTFKTLGGGGVALKRILGVGFIALGAKLALEKEY